MKIKILYEDPDILAINKPSGVLVHPDRHSRAKTILDLLRDKYPKLEVVHRLDRETSGVMLLAKNQKAHEFLKGQFMGREIKKTYLAIVSGFVKNDCGVINKPIGRSPKDFRRHISGRGARGEMREAITQYKVLKRFEVALTSLRFLPLRPQAGPSGTKILKTSPQKFSFLEIRPKTGRTHQIRVHLKFLNHPIVCDSLYNPNGLCPKSISRLALHAKSIEFRNLKGKTIKVESPLPAFFSKIK